MQTQLKWYAILCSSVLLLFLAYYYGFAEQLYNADITKLSWIIIGIFFIMSLKTGVTLHTKRTGTTDFEWFMAESMLSLGMVGTVVGFIYMLSVVFNTIDINQINTVQAALSQMATGMGTALWTTLVGLIFSLIYKTQLVVIDDNRDS